MNQRTLYLVLTCSLSLGVAASPGESTSPPARRDGQHDFDFNIGTWKSRIRRLQHPLTGSSTWVELEGTVAVRPVWGGQAQLEEIEADGPTGHFEGLTLFLYNPQSHQWSQYFANSRDGILARPDIGEFKDGRGELYGQETFEGRSILVRIVWSDITQESHHFEQSFSDDGGKTWEPNFVATLTRMPAGAPDPQARSAAPEIQHDFDFHFGQWKTHVSRLEKPLSGAGTWAEYDGTSEVGKVWNGRASLFELEVGGRAGHIEGLGLRLYNPQARQWSLNWASRADGAMTQPMIGAFKDGCGEFHDREAFHGRTISVRNGFSEITPDSSRFEQAFSDDGGQTWETNWVMTFTRTPDAARATRATAPVSRRPGVETRDGRHDFDWEVGSWKIHVERLQHPLTGSRQWTQLDGTVECRKVWDGRANLAEIDVQGPSGRLQFLSLRLYDPESRQWSLNFASSNVGVFSQPMIGEFKDGRGEFYDQEAFEGRTILVRFLFMAVSSDAGRSEQAFSDDGGRTWETNWINTYTRVE